MQPRKFAAQRLLMAIAMPAMLTVTTGTTVYAQSGELTVYSSHAEPVSKALTEGFNERYPEIDVTLLRLVTGNLATRFANEAVSGVNAADVIIIATPVVFEENPEWFRPLSGVEAYDDWPDDLKTENHAKAVFAESLIFYNTNNVSEEESPKAWSDLLDPKWKGRITLVDPSSAETYMSWAFHIRETFGDEFLTTLAKQDLTIAKGGVDAAQAVASGAADIAVPPAATHATALLKQDAPIGIVPVGQPTLGNETSIAIAAKAPNPENAQIFLEWYLSEEGQGIACAEVSSSGLGDVSGCLPFASDYVTPEFGISEAEAAEIMALLGMR
ncbi:ABC transporter substrate-binding protein [Devosia naphthalenivorans]|uniref:ABC transporter substrate-binding protein n=1 Tax=Devosia naphthalenivorans TaxID=2082392 RepID=UPI0013B059DB|nr:extracellular solute-binding protein [Devosia naphthalenivorans]